MYNRTTVGDPTAPKDKIPPVNQDANQKFGNWTGSTDTKVMAADLMKRGLTGADQILYDQPNTNDANSIRNSQGDWKLAAIQNILANAHKLGIRTPEAVMANKDVLIGNSKWKDAINNPAFKNIHPNFWGTITDSILP